MTQPPMTKESQALVSSLAAQRDHVLGILEGLSEEDLRRPILPSQWTCAGLVHHLAIDVERFWFRAVVAGEPIPDDEPENAWQVPSGLTAPRCWTPTGGRSSVPMPSSPPPPWTAHRRGGLRPVWQLAARRPARDPPACDR